METKKSLENEALSKEKELLSDKELSEVAGGGGRFVYIPCDKSCEHLKGNEKKECLEKCSDLRQI